MTKEAFTEQWEVDNPPPAGIMDDEGNIMRDAQGNIIRDPLVHFLTTSAGKSLKKIGGEVKGKMLGSLRLMLRNYERKYESKFQEHDMYDMWWDIRGSKQAQRQIKAEFHQNSFTWKGVDDKGELATIQALSQEVNSNTETIPLQRMVEAAKEKTMEELEKEWEKRKLAAWTEYEALNPTVNDQVAMIGLMWLKSGRQSLKVS